MRLTVVEQIEMFIKFNTMRNTKVHMAIVCEEEGNEILVDLDTPIEWNIVPKCFLLPLDPQDGVRNLMTYLRNLTNLQFIIT